jgi:hypothetical protein
MDLARREYGISNDFVVQTEVYQRMLCEQEETEELRHFLSCGLISRVHRISVLTEKGKLKLVRKQVHTLTINVAKCN